MKANNLHNIKKMVYLVFLGSCGFQINQWLIPNAYGVETLSMSIVGGPLLSRSSLDTKSRVGVIGGAVFNFAPGALSWEFEVLGAMRKFETTSAQRVSVIHGQFGAVVRGYALGTTKSTNLSIGLGPYIGKPLKKEASIDTDQLEVGASFSARWDINLPIKFGPFAIGVLLESRITAGRTISGVSKPNYFDAGVLAGVRFGVL